MKRNAARARVGRKVSPHTCRHRYLTNMLAAGLTIRDVQMLAGHSHVKTALIYIHVSDDVTAEKSQLCDLRRRRGLDLLGHGQGAE